MLPTKPAASRIGEPTHERPSARVPASRASMLTVWPISAAASGVSATSACVTRMLTRFIDIGSVTPARPETSTELPGSNSTLPVAKSCFQSFAVLVVITFYPVLKGGEDANDAFLTGLHGAPDAVALIHAGLDQRQPARDDSCGQPPKYLCALNNTRSAPAFR